NGVMKGCVLPGDRVPSGQDCPPPATIPLDRIQLYDWTDATAANVTNWVGYRQQGTQITAAGSVEIGQSPNAATKGINATQELPNGVQFTFWVKAKLLEGGLGDPTNPATVTAVNHAPVANADSYSVDQDTVLNVAAAGVLANDTDDDSPATSKKAVAFSG